MIIIKKRRSSKKLSKSLRHKPDKNICRIKAVNFISINQYMKGLSCLDVNGRNGKFLRPAQLKKFIAVEET